MNDKRKADCPLCGAPDAGELYRLESLTVLRCRSCMQVFTYPQISQEESRKLYDKSYYDSWGIECDESVREMKKCTFALKLNGLEKIISPGRILDVGCATGFFLEVASERGWDAYGVEINPFAVKEVRKQFADRVYEGTIEDAPFDPQSLDAVVMSDVLEHVTDPLATLCRVNELLRNRGLAAITTPNIGGITARVFGKRWPHLKPEHQFYFTPQTVSYLLGKAGFHVVSSRPALKALSLNYIYAQRNVSRVPLLTAFVTALRNVLPPSLLQKPLYFLAGEMFVIARKKPVADPR